MSRLSSLCLQQGTAFGTRYLSCLIKVMQFCTLMCKLASYGH